MKIEIEKEDLKELYLLLEEMNDLFHQPAKYEDREVISNFSKKKYPKIKKMYYETIWKLLPDDIKTEFENR